MVEELITIDELMAEIDQPAENILFWLERTSLPHEKINGVLRFSRDEALAWWASQKRVPILPPQWHKKLKSPVSELDPAHLIPPLELESLPSWLLPVYEGDFSRLPDPMTWDHGESLALLIDGYQIAPLLGFEDCFECHGAKREHFEKTGRWEGTAIELWISLFAEQRIWRNHGYPPEDQDRENLDLLSQSVRHMIILEGE